MGKSTRAIQLKYKPADFAFKVFLFLLTAEIGIVFLDIFLNYLEWIPFRSLRKVFNITREDGLGNWFSSFDTLLVGVVAFLLYAFSKGSQLRRRGWFAVGALFTYFAIDDGTQFHERVGSAVHEFLEHRPAIGNVFWFPTYDWHLVYLPVLFIAGLSLMWFFWKEFGKRKLLWIYVLSAFSCLSLAVCLDFVEGLNLPGWTEYPTVHMMKVLEEFLEMVGMSLFLTAFLTVYLERHGDFSVSFES